MVKNIFLYIFIIILLALTGCTIDDVRLEPLTPDHSVSEGNGEFRETSKNISDNNLQIPSSEYIKFFNGAKIIQHRPLNETNYLITLQTIYDLPQDSANRFLLYVNSRRYSCMMIQPECKRIYCVGEIPSPGTIIQAQAYISEIEWPIVQETLIANSSSPKTEKLVVSDPNPEKLDSINEEKRIEKLIAVDNQVGGGKIIPPQP